MMFDAVFFEGNHRGKVDIFHTPENIFHDHRVSVLQHGQQFFDLLPLGALFLILSGNGCLCHAAGALNKLKIIVVFPTDDIPLPNQI